jgi:hypothetical protein
VHEALTPEVLDPPADVDAQTVGGFRWKQLPESRQQTEQT